MSRAEAFQDRQAQAERRAQAERHAPAMLVDEREARRLLGGLCAKTLWTLRKTAGLPAVKIGSRTMYRPADLSAWIDAQAAGGAR